MIEFDKIYFRYDQHSKDILKDLSLTIHDNEMVAIIGKNGAGKTTLIKHINGLLKPNTGVVRINGKEITKEPLSKMASIVGLAFQNPNHQLFAQTVRKELEFGPKNLGMNEEERNTIIQDIVNQFQIEHLLEKNPLELSGGERRLVSIASVLTLNQKILVLDEPTFGQDYKQKKRLGKFLQQLSKNGITIVIVSHDVDFVLDFFPRVIVLFNGEIIADGNASEIFSNNALLDKADLVSPILLDLSQELRTLNTNFPTAVVEETIFEKIFSIFNLSRKNNSGEDEK